MQCWCILCKCEYSYIVYSVIITDLSASIVRLEFRYILYHVYCAESPVSNLVLLISLDLTQTVVKTRLGARRKWQNDGKVLRDWYNHFKCSFDGPRLRIESIRVCYRSSRFSINVINTTYRWDEQNSTCWWKNPNDKLRLRWLIGTQSFWIMFAAAIEMFCSCVVLIWMFRFHVRDTSSSTNFSDCFAGSHPTHDGLQAGFKLWPKYNQSGIQ